jgi:methylenetetrahydrofolate reductase (NADPH)
VDLANAVLDGGAPGLHVYTFNRHRAALALVEGAGLADAPVGPSRPLGPPPPVAPTVTPTPTVARSRDLETQEAS